MANEKTHNGGDGNGAGRRRDDRADFFSLMLAFRDHFDALGETRRVARRAGPADEAAAILAIESKLADLESELLPSVRGLMRAEALRLMAGTRSGPRGVP